MPRAMWSGSITFGLVNVPIKLYPAVQDKDVHFHMLSKDGSCRLRRKLVCPETGKEYDFKDTAKGYEIAPDQYVIVTEDELKSLKPDGGRTIDITDFVDLEEIDPVYFNRPYWLAPDENGAKAYHLLLEAMTRTGRVGIARFVMRGKEYLAAIRPRDHALCLEIMNYADELVPAADVPGVPIEAKVNAKELEVAKRLIDALAGDFEPEKYHETYRERMLELIEKKAAGEEITIHEPEEEAPRVFNLMKALEESLERAKHQSGHSRRRRKSA